MSGPRVLKVSSDDATVRSPHAARLQGFVEE